MDEQKIKAVWVSNVANIDLPPVTKDSENYKKKVREIFEVCKWYGFNTIFFQVRTTNDAFYKSELNPYSRYLTEEEGKEPPFDPLQLVIDLGKEYNIAIHAWCNPYRVSLKGDLGKEGYLATCDAKNFAKKNPNFLIEGDNKQLIFNPGEPEVRKFVVETLKELVKSYEVAGVHLDDYFYPYEGLEAEVDKKSFEQYNSQNLSLADWRRENINILIKESYNAIKSVNRELQFGISPFGIWRNSQNGKGGANVAEGCFESYDKQYADSAKWVKNRWLDYITPQVYWEFNHKVAPFAPIVDWWSELCSEYNMPLYIGHGLYKEIGENFPVESGEIAKQLEYVAKKGIEGKVIFTFNNLITLKKQSLEEAEKLKTALNR